MVKDFYHKYKTHSDTLNYVLLAGIAGFVISLLLAIFPVAEGEKLGIIRYLLLPINLKSFIFQAWTIVTWPIFFPINPHWFFSFMINSVFIYQFGRLLHRYLGEKKLRNLLIIAGFFIALATIGITNVLPGGKETYLHGLSPILAAITAALITLIPNQKIQLVIFGQVKLWIVGLVVIGIMVISHLGPPEQYPEVVSVLIGGIAGFGYIKLLDKGVDIGGELAGIFEFKPQVKREKGEKGRVIPFTPKSRQVEIDRILDKINEVGYEALTRKEKEFLSESEEK